MTLLVVMERMMPIISLFKMKSQQRKMSHPSFANHWFHIYEVQDQGCIKLIFANLLFFEIEFVVLENVYPANFIGGHYTQREFGALFSSRVGAALGLSFPGCLRSFEFEFKSADVFFLYKTL
jgi:hypothetical protein